MKLSRALLFLICVKLLIFPHFGKGQINEFPEIRQSHPEAVNALISLGISLRDQNMGDSALLIWLEALQQSNHIDYLPGMDSALRLMTHSFWDLDYGLKYGQIMRQAVDYTRHKDVDPILFARLLSQYGTTMHKEGLYLQSMRIYKEALTQIQHNTSVAAQKLKIDLHHKIAAVCIAFNEIDQAYAWIHTASEMRTPGLDTLIAFRESVTKSMIHYRLKNTDSSCLAAAQAYRIGQILRAGNQIPWINFISISTHYSLMLIDEKLADKAIELFAQEDSLFLKLVEEKQRQGYHLFDLQPILLERNTIKGYAYYTLGKYTEAASIATHVLHIAHSNGIQSITGDAHKLLSMIYAAEGRYQLAYEHEKRHFDLRFNLIETTQNRTMAEQYEAEKNQALAVKQLLIQQQESELADKNRLLIFISICLTLLSIALIFIWKNYSHKQKLQLSNERNRRQTEEINRLMARMEGEQQERKRIAHELHDGIVSQLTGLVLNVNALQESQNELQPRQLQNIAQQLREATDDLRKTTHNLMPDLLLEQGLCLSVAALCEKTAGNTQLDVDFEAYGNIPKLLPDAELSIYRIIQELLQNAIKHANPTRIFVQIGAREDSLNITVEDDGTGFSQDAHGTQKQRGIGMQNLKDRVTKLHGELDIRSTSGLGTTAYIEFSLKNLIWAK